MKIRYLDKVSVKVDYQKKEGVEKRGNNFSW